MDDGNIIRYVVKNAPTWQHEVCLGCEFDLDGKVRVSRNRRADGRKIEPLSTAYRCRCRPGTVSYKKARVGGPGHPRRTIEEGE